MRACASTGYPPRFPPKKNAPTTRLRQAPAPLSTPISRQPATVNLWAPSIYGILRLLWASLCGMGTRGAQAGLHARLANRSAQALLR